MGGSGTTTVSAGANLVIAGPGTKILDARTLNLQGTTNWSGPGAFGMQTGAILNNSGNFDVQGDLNLFLGGATPAFNNSGTFTKSAGSAALVIGVGFNNTGTVNGNSGQIRFNAGGSATGDFVAASGAAIEFNGATYTLNTGADLSGAGFVRLSSGTLTIANAVSAERFEITSGTLNGTGTLTVSNLLNWSGGTMGGSGATTIPVGANAVITGSVTKLLDARTLNLQGTATWTGTGGLGLQNAAVINNSGSFDMQGDLNLLASGGAASSINNSGTFTKSSGTGTGTISVAFNNTGTFQIVSGTLNVPGGFTNQNLIAIGKAGRLNVQGAFSQNAVAIIRLDIAGTAAGTFGRVTATGAATINGTLDLRLVDGFAPNVSDVFTVFTYASRTGTFVTITDNDVAHLFNPTYNATNLTLTVA
jgi:hypothetical protein